MAESLPDALALPAANRRIGVLVGNTDLPDGRGLGLAKAARAIHPKLGGIYPSRMLHRVPARERVTGALCLRLPCHPHPLVGVTGLLTGRLASDDEAQVAEEPLETSR